ncbi:HAD hydrolase-like protein [Bifidobacterium sp. ESL0763]|uniref:HAD hydrolase-like protein n=1 Tax=Bifidobacterium sp. ESL0763 TaxID=2983227 RepID=UPI0023F89558|nr:HAD hydrolase-like protein [Bifidobacterium sp. ESL0763]MDF7663797.1 HAD hydrolase-like protein [Bifidobacterium sp. ESL0763]
MNVVLLDLDGTLTRSEPGIIAALRRAYDAMDLPLPDADELRRFIGPSILESFARNGVPEPLAQLGLRTFRMYYDEKAVFDRPHHPGIKIPGKYLGELYPGILGQLERLHHAGYRLAVASCKPEYQAVPVCEHFGASKVLDDIFGASRDGSRRSKEQVIRYGFDRIGFDKAHSDRALMVGDRWTDVDGAKAVGIDCLGCGWGYAEPDELESHGAYRVLDRVDGLADAVEEYFAQ